MRRPTRRRHGAVARPLRSAGRGPRRESLGRRGSLPTAGARADVPRARAQLIGLGSPTMLTQADELAVPRTATPPPLDEPVVITGAAVGTPGTEKVFDDGNLSR